MKLTSRISQNPDIDTAVKELTNELDIRLLSTFVIYFTENYDAKKLSATLASKLPNIPFIGCTSYKGVMTDQGVFTDPVIALMGIYDNSISAYGTGFSDLDTFNHDINKAVTSAINQALISANRIGEVPSLVLLHSTPGNEEHIIDQIDNVFGSLVPIIGGSSANSSQTNNWSVISDQSYSKDGLAISLLFPSKSVSSGFSAGYSPTEYSGTITKSEGRLIYKIDGKPANDVYKQWINSYSDSIHKNRGSFEEVTKFPLGRIAGKLYDQPYYKLTHPLYISDEGPLALFANVEEGEKITLMTGDIEQLLNRATRVIKEANAKNYSESLPLGAILIFCAGAMLRIGDNIEKIHQYVCAQLDNQPFVCPFTYGEQGRFPGGQNTHGNLMISTIIFYES